MSAGGRLAVVLTTFPADFAVEALLSEIVGAGLAACAQRDAPIVSWYMWEGTLQKVDEVRVWFKTTHALVPQLYDLVVAQHPYTLPQWLVLDALASASYFTWVEQSVRPR